MGQGSSEGDGIGFFLIELKKRERMERGRYAMITIDEILAILQDGKWHDIEEIKAQSGASERVTEIALSFLQKYGFIERDTGEHRVRAEKLYMNFVKDIAGLNAQTSEVPLSP